MNGPTFLTPATLLLSPSSHSRAPARKQLSDPLVVRKATLGWEGIVSKRKDSTYRSGRSPDGSRRAKR